MCLSELYGEGESLADSPSVCVRVFTVLYDYDPFQSSPNDQPDSELPLSAGEHVFVTGDVDEVSWSMMIFHSGDRTALKVKGHLQLLVVTRHRATERLSFFLSSLPGGLLAQR